MDSFIVFVLLMAAAFVLVDLAQRLRIPYPLTLILGGGIIGFIPALPPFSYDPQRLLLIVLPPIVYYGSFWISYNEFKTKLVDIVSLALGLVIATTLIIGLFLKWLFPEIPWALAFAFGAIVSPPDAIAATSILKQFAIRSRIETVLEGESLINDAVALTLYKLAVVGLLTGIFSWSDGLWGLCKMLTIGGVVGLVAGYAILRFANSYLLPIAGVIFSFVVPYLTYFLAEALGGSGVLAVVLNGLVLSRIYIKHLHTIRRILAVAPWDVAIIMLNCFVFVLLGYQLKTILADISIKERALYTGYALLITALMIAIRMVWVFSTRLVSYFLSKREQRYRVKQLFQEGIILGWSGMRGIVSLIAVLALPIFAHDGTPVQDRQIVIFIAYVVILLTLIIPGLSLPYILRRLNIPYYRELRLVRRYRQKLLETAKKEIRTYSYLSEEERAFLENYFHARHRVLDISSSEDCRTQDLEAARRKVIAAQRQHLKDLWQKREADEKPLKRLQLELDIEETVIIRAEIK